MEKGSEGEDRAEQTMVTLYSFAVISVITSANSSYNLMIFNNNVLLVEVMNSELA